MKWPNFSSKREPLESLGPDDIVIVCVIRYTLSSCRANARPTPVLWGQLEQERAQWVWIVEWKMTFSHKGQVYQHSSGCKGARDVRFIIALHEGIYVCAMYVQEFPPTGLCRWPRILWFFIWQHFIGGEGNRQDNKRVAKGDVSAF